MSERKHIDPQEVKEALAAAEHALRCLEEAQTALQSARNWGIFDIMGGGLVSTLVKRGRMHQAAEKIDLAKASIQTLKRELRDVPSMNSDLLRGGFLGFADMFMDGVVADWLTQRRINDARSQVQEAVNRVRRIRDELRAMK